MTAVRRSSRARRQATSVYDEARRDMEEQETMDSDEERSKDGSGTECESLPDNMNRGIDSFSSDDHSSGDENSPTRNAETRSSSSTSKKIGRSRGGHTTNTQVAHSSTTPSTVGTGMPIQPRRGACSALATLSKKVLDESENEGNALVAALLRSCKRTPGTTVRRTRGDGTTPYTRQLQAVAQKVVSAHKEDSNKAQIDLLNMIFRSVGGTIETNLDQEAIVLEDMAEDEWATVVTSLVDAMRHTPADCVLFCADPMGALHAATLDSGNEAAAAEAQLGPSSTGLCAYRDIYEEFWYLLGCMALSGENGSTDNPLNGVDKFGAEIVRELVTRMTELITVGQPDVRAAATVAALQLGHALLNKTVELTNMIEAEKENSGRKQSKPSQETEARQHQQESIRRICADLEEMVHSAVVQGIFMHRYRDVNMHIRAACIHSLSRMTLQRPDLFLEDKYLKYLGWMISDKAACVRAASLSGLKAPFDVKNTISNVTTSKGVSSRIDPMAMENLLTRFLPRIVDCTIDVSIQVQENAIALLRQLVPVGIMENLEEDHLWQQLNARALAGDTTASVRRNALYLVLDQLHSFDESPKASSMQGDKSPDMLTAERLDDLASWLAHTLCDGPIALKNIRIELVDYVVESLRLMPEHKPLVTSWPIIIQAIMDEISAGTEGGRRSRDRGDVAKQRVLVRLLTCAADAEVEAVANRNFLRGDIDPDRYETQPVGEYFEDTSSYAPGIAHEELSNALLKSLPELLIKFKGDEVLLRSIAILSRYILPSVCNLAQRQDDFDRLLKSLSEVYVSSADDMVLHNVALSLSFMSKGERSRASDTRTAIKKLVLALCDRTIQLLENSEPEPEPLAAGKRRAGRHVRGPSKKSRVDSGALSNQLSSTISEEDSTSEVTETYKAITHSLKRLNMLSKRMNVAALLRQDNLGMADDDVNSTTLEDVMNLVVRETASRLEVRLARDGDSVPQVWKTTDSRVHSSVADAVSEALSFLLSCLAWKISVVQDQELHVSSDQDITMSHVDEVEEDELEDHPVVVMREQLVKLLELCFSNLPQADSHGMAVTKEQVTFSDRVQTIALHCSSDLRMLLPREWADASSSLLRAFSLRNDGHLIGGSLRWFRSQEDQLRDLGRLGSDDSDLARNLLVPLGRSVAVDWRNGNRREAGVLLSHITGSGKEASKLVSSISHVLKKNDAKRLLESHMACLMQSFEDWIQSEPEEVGLDRPTDQDMAEFDAAERKHVERFAWLGQLATKLCLSHGVGAWKDPKLSSGIINFLRKGLSYAFSHNEHDGLLLGCRLSFLIVLSKYVGRILRNKNHQEQLRLDLNERVAQLREHPDFSEVHEDDLGAIVTFRSAVGLKDDSPAVVSPSSDIRRLNADDESIGDGTSVRGMAPSPSSHVSRSRPRLSKGSSVGSVTSRLSSAQNSLSPLPEEDDGSLSSPSPPRRGRSKSRNVSVGSTRTVSTLGKSIIEEGIEEDGSE